MNYRVRVLPTRTNDESSERNSMKPILQNHFADRSQAQSFFQEMAKTYHAHDVVLEEKTWSMVDSYLGHSEPKNKGSESPEPQA